MHLTIILQKKDLKILIFYHYHNPDTGKIVISNQSKRKYCNVHVEIFNDTRIRFIYHIEEILPRVGVLIDYANNNDIEGNRFFGNIQKINVNNGKDSKEFVPTEDFKFEVD